MLMGESYVLHIGDLEFQRNTSVVGLLENLEIKSVSGQKSLLGMTYSSTNYEQPFFLPLYPLDNLTCTLCKCIAIGIGASNTVKFKYWSHPSKRTG